MGGRLNGLQAYIIKEPDQFATQTERQRGVVVRSAHSFVAIALPSHANPFPNVIVVDRRKWRRMVYGWSLLSGKSMCPLLMRLSPFAVDLQF